MRYLIRGIQVDIQSTQKNLYNSTNKQTEKQAKDVNRQFFPRG